jgi:hypothetical protein
VDVLKSEVDAMKASSLSTAARVPLSARISAGALALGTGAFASWCWLARGYYRSPLPDQAIDSRYSALRSAGTFGILFGILAVVLMLVNLAYLIRRRLPVVGRYGSLRAWLDVHVVTGLLAGACVLLHSGFTLRSAAGSIAGLSLAVVLFTGVIGRWVLAQIPRTREGRELSLDEAKARFEELRNELSHHGLPPLETSSIISRETSSPLMALLRVLTGDPGARAEHRRYRDLLALKIKNPDERRRLEPILHRILSEAQALVRLQELSALMASWRFLHRWLALVMVGTAACHIVIALNYARFAAWAHWLRFSS